MSTLYIERIFTAIFTMFTTLGYFFTNNDKVEGSSSPLSTYQDL